MSDRLGSFGPGDNFGPGDDFDPAVHSAGDVTSAAAAAAATDGIHVVGQASDLTLSIRVEAGRVAEWVITDGMGGLVPTEDVAKGMTCWKCGKDTKGDKHCWVVPCPEIPNITPVVGGMQRTDTQPGSTSGTGDPGLGVASGDPEEGGENRTI